MIRHAMTAAMAALILAGPPAIAQSTTAITDGEITQCIVAMTMLGKSATGADLSNIQSVTFYFVGKLAARHAPADIKVLIDNAKIDNAKMDTVAVSTECAKEVTALGTALSGK